MDDLLSISGRLLAILVLVAVNGFFVAAEFALVSVRRTRVEQMVRDGRLGAAAIAHGQEHLDTFIAACQLGITMASLALGWIGEPALAGLIEPPLERLLGGLAPAASHGVATGISFAFITMVLVTIGELAPKGMALAAPDRVALFVAAPTNLFTAVFRPAIWLLNTAGWLVLRPFGIRPRREHGPVGSLEELMLVIMASREAGLLEEQEQRMVNRVFALSTLSARQVMVPRTEVVAMDIEASLDEVLKTLQEHRHTRFPVYEGSIDNIVGVLNVKELLRLLQDQQFGGLKRFLRPPLNVPESMKVDDLLTQLRRQRIQMAVVIDEFGGTAGIVTIEDILERIVGEVQSELERPEMPQVVPLPDGSTLLDGLLLLDDVNEQFELELRDDNYDTIGGYLFGRLGRRANRGDEVTINGGRCLRVEEMDGLRIARVRLLPPAAREEQRSTA